MRKVAEAQEKGSQLLLRLYGMKGLCLAEEQLLESLLTMHLGLQLIPSQFKNS